MADRIQFRRDTAANWSAANPVLLEGEIGLVLDQPNQYKVGNGSSAWNSLPLRGFDGTVAQSLGSDTGAVMSQAAVTEVVEQHIAMATSGVGAVPVIKDYLYSFASYKGVLVSSERYDCVIVKILPGTKSLRVEGGVPEWFIFFDTELIGGTYINSMNNGNNVPSTAKMCVIDFNREDNPDGVDVVRVYQEGMAVSFEDLGEEGTIDAIATSMAVIDKGDKIEPVVHSNSIINTNGEIRTNNNFYVFEYDVAVLREEGKKMLWVYLPTYDTSSGAGNVYVCLFTNEAGMVVRKTWGKYAPSDIRRTGFTVYIPQGAEKMYINVGSSTWDNMVDYRDMMEWGVWQVKFFRTGQHTILPFNLNAIGNSGIAHSPLLLRGLYVDLSSGNRGQLRYGPWYDSIIVAVDGDEKIDILFSDYYPQKTYSWYGGDGLLRQEDYIASYDNSNIVPNLPGIRYCVITVRTISLSYDTAYGYVAKKFPLIINGKRKSLETINRAVEKFEERVITPTQTIQGEFLLSNGSVKENSNMFIDRYDDLDFSKQILFSARYTPGFNINLVFYFNGDTFLGCEYISYLENRTFDRVPLHPLPNTTNIRVNRQKSSYARLSVNARSGEYYDLNSLNTYFDKSLRVHVYGLTTEREADLFYVRSHYNSSKDMIRVYRTNDNGCISHDRTYIGERGLEDSVMMTSAYLIHSPSDSTGPFFNSPEYWHLFAQHGYVIPILNNSVGMTSADVGARWKDQLDREYTIGQVTDTYIYLLPVFTSKVEGEVDRGWKTPNSTKITQMTYVSGGMYTTSFAANQATTDQIRPIMSVTNRQMTIDRTPITAPGDYSCDEFSISELQYGYDPAEVETWFPSPVLEGVPLMAQFTWAYNFRGNTCAVNTTVKILRKVSCQSYGACQQQFFYDKENYQALFLIPKLKPQGDVDPSKLFHSGSSDGPSMNYTRNETDLLSVDDPVDRQIGILYDSSTNDYLVGLAAGLSLVSGDTVREKRNVNIPVSSKRNGYDRLGSFSPSNTNKFYIAAVNTDIFEDDNHNFPVDYFKEINYFVSYFDPAENPWGQVFWYKDGGSYIVYIHCQSTQKNQRVVLPDFMEGLTLQSIVEKTDNAELLTNTITNRSLFVNFNTADGGWIVGKFM